MLIRNADRIHPRRSWDSAGIKARVLMIIRLANISGQVESHCVWFRSQPHFLR
jgi:hypothetical protein